jgi:hypothetical protein
VALGGAVVRSDAQGTFVVDDDGRSPLLAAASPGHRRAAAARGSGFAPFVVLTLGGPPLSIRGRVVDEHGRGLGGVRVWARDATLLADARSPETTEGIAAGCATMSELEERFRRGELRDPETALRDTPTTSWPWVRTDADGCFLLHGLEDRVYTLRAMDDRTALLVDGAEAAAGSEGAVLVLRRDALFAKVQGQVVSRRGAPVSGVRIVVQTDPHRLGRSTAHGRAAASATTDAEGRFELRDVPKALAYLRLDGEEILPLEYGRGAAGGLLELSRGDVENLRIEVGVRMHVQVELEDAARADELAVLDADGQAIMINVLSGRGRRETGSLRFAEGRTPVFVVPDTAATVVLRKGGAEVRRQALDLRTGAVNSLRL